jgi:hypothetical protein
LIEIVLSYAQRCPAQQHAIGTSKGVDVTVSFDGAGGLTHVPHSEYVNVTDASSMVAGDRNTAFSQAVVDFPARTVPVPA